MTFTYFLFFLLLNQFHYSKSLQTGYTCEPSVILTCPQSKKLVILEVTYSSECPTSKSEGQNGSSIYAPSRCIGYYRERASTQCNGLQTCTIDNSVEQRPSFLTGKQANCPFKGQSINIEYSCIPDFYSSKLPRIDMCSLQLLDDIKEGFIHTPNYPNGYSNSLTCSKIVPAPDGSHRLKIYAVEFDVESVSVGRSQSVARVNDWLEINNNDEKLYGTRPPYTLLFDDVIEASLVFKSDAANSKRSYNGFLLYYIVTPIRRTRPKTTKETTTTTIEILHVPFDDETTSLIEQKSSALVTNTKRQNNIGLTLLVILLSIILFATVCIFLLYKRGNDRRLRYLTETFKSFSSNRSKPATLNSFADQDETKLQHKFHSSPISYVDQLIPKSTNKKVENINSDNIYSQDPLEYRNSCGKNDKNSLLYGYVDTNQQQNEESIYETINSNNDQQSNYYVISKENNA